jgi:hypothetical protein
MVARNAAGSLLRAYFGQEPPFPADFRSSVYQMEGGGLALLPYGGADLDLSAKVAAVAPDLFGRPPLAQYFRDILADPEVARARGIVALFGLAALGEPVLPTVQDAMGAPELSWRERVFLGLAAAELGDWPSAERVYRELLASFGQARGDMLRLNVGGEPDDVLEATALAAALGAQLADDRAPALFRYTTANTPAGRVLDLERVLYLAAALPGLPGEPVRFRYSLGGERVEAELERGESIALLPGGEGLAGLQLQVEKGRLGVVAISLVPVDPAALAIDPALSVWRAYQPGAPAGEEAPPLPPPPAPGEEPPPVSIQEGQLVRVVLGYELASQAVDGCYQVLDLLPSGLKPVTRPAARGLDESDENIAFPYDVSGQRVSFCVSKSDEPRKPLVYYARVLGLGRYTAEPALIQSMLAPQSVNLSAPSEVTIR